MIKPFNYLMFTLVPLLAMPQALADPAADEILIASPYVRAVPAISDNSAMFVTLKNTGSTNRALISAASRAAKVVELHTHINDGGIMRMRKVDKIDLKAKEATVLKPGGLHVMLIGLRRPLEVGATVQVDLKFDDGSSKSVVAPIKSVMAMRHHEGSHAKPATDRADESMGPVFVNLTSDDNWRASMALNWTRKAIARGHKATVWLNVEAVRLAVNDVAHPVHAMQDKSAQDLLREVMVSGGKVLVCGGCLKRAGFTRGNLIEGVEMGSPNRVMPAMFDKSAKVVSW